MAPRRRIGDSNAIARSDDDPFHWVLGTLHDPLAILPLSAGECAVIQSRSGSAPDRARTTGVIAKPAEALGTPIEPPGWSGIVGRAALADLAGCGCAGVVGSLDGNAPSLETALEPGAEPPDFFTVEEASVACCASDGRPPMRYLASGVTPRVVKDSGCAGRAAVAVVGAEEMTGGRITISPTTPNRPAAPSVSAEEPVDRSRTTTTRRPSNVDARAPNSPEQAPLPSPDPRCTTTPPAVRSQDRQLHRRCGSHAKAVPGAMPVLSIGVMKTAGWEYYAREVADGLEDYYAARAKRRVCGPVPARTAAGVVGTVSAEALALAFGEARHPETGEQLGGPWRPDGVIGFDATFSAPKSVSLLFALGDRCGARPRCGGACEWRLRTRRLAYLEDRAVHASGSQRGDDQRHRRLVIARFEHRTSRASGPAAALALSDPQQGPRRPRTASWRALHGRALFEEAKTAGMLYQAGVAGRAHPPPRGGVGSGE